MRGSRREDPEEKIQRRGARFVRKDYHRRASVTSMLRELKWEPLVDRRRKSRLGLFFQIISGEVAIPMDIEYLKPGRRGRYQHLDFKHQAYQHSFFAETIRDWNSLNQDSKASKTVNTFKAQLPTNSY